MEFLGLSPAGANDIPATHPDKARGRGRGRHGWPSSW